MINASGFDFSALKGAGFAGSGIAAAGILASPLGPIGGLVCGGVGSLVGDGVEWIIEQIVPDQPWSTTTNYIVIITILAAKILAMVAITGLLAPLFGVQMTLKGAFIFTSLVQTIGSLVNTAPVMHLLKSKMEDRFNRIRIPI